MLKQRLITAGVLIPLIIMAVVLLPNHYFAILTALIIGIGAMEWSHLSGITQSNSVYLYATTVFIVCMLIYYLVPESIKILIVQAAVVWWLVAFIMVASYQMNVMNIPKQRGMIAFIGLLVLVPAWLSIVLLQQQQQGIVLVLLLFAIIWIADSIAYFAGRRWGKRRLADRVSPGKSWEGAIVAVLSSVIIAFAYTLIHNMSVKGLLVFLLLCLITVVSSIFGDLFESLIKRGANIKDSGGLLPGHGGILDRIDSMTAAAPIFFTALYWTGYWP